MYRLICKYLGQIVQMVLIQQALGKASHLPPGGHGANWWRFSIIGIIVILDLFGRCEKSLCGSQHLKWHDKSRFGLQTYFSSILYSMGGHRMVPSADEHFYCATKYAVTALTEGIRQELREANTHIRATVRSECAGLVIVCAFSDTLDHILFFFFFLAWQQ